MDKKQGKIIGLTGGIGCGKSTAARQLEKMGAYIVSADIIARESLLPSSPLIDDIRYEFGEEVFLCYDIIDRKKLGSVVFSDPEKLKKLNEIMHPYIKEHMQWFAQNAFRLYNFDVAVFDAPLLIEVGLDEYVDEIWLVTSPVVERIRRIMERDHSTAEDAMRRISARMSDEELAKHADFVLANDGSVDDFTTAVSNLYTERFLKE